MAESFTSDEASVEGGRISTEQVNAVLFYQVAKFLLWGQAHTDVAEAHPDFGHLLRNAAEILTRSGTLEHDARFDDGKPGQTLS